MASIGLRIYLWGPQTLLSFSLFSSSFLFTTTPPLPMTSPSALYPSDLESFSSSDTLRVVSQSPDLRSQNRSTPLLASPFPNLQNPNPRTPSLASETSQETAYRSSSMEIMPNHPYTETFRVPVCILSGISRVVCPTRLQASCPSCSPCDCIQLRPRRKCSHNRYASRNHRTAS